MLKKNLSASLLDKINMIFSKVPQLYNWLFEIFTLLSPKECTDRLIQKTQIIRILLQPASD